MAVTWRPVKRAPNPVLLRGKELAFNQRASAAFATGSALFGLGALVAIVAPDWSAGSVVANACYSTGAVFFTIGGYTQWRLAVIHAPRERELQRVLFDLRNPDWIASAVQFVGTVTFNVMTLAALASSITTWTRTEEQDWVWGPDMFGSVMFLVASAVAFVPLSRARRHSHVPERSWVIVWANMFGSVMFGASAVADYYLTSAEVLNVPIMNWGTFLGAIGFYVGAALMWPPKRTAHLAYEDYLAEVGEVELDKLGYHLQVADEELAQDLRRDWNRWRSNRE